VCQCESFPRMQAFVDRLAVIIWAGKS
jgi:hypothetical protein